MMGNNKSKQVEKYSIKTIYHGFVSNLENLQLFVNRLSPVATRHDKASIDQINRVMDKTFKIMGFSKRELLKKVKNNEKINIKLNKKQGETVINTLKALPKDMSLHNIELLHKSSFIMLTCYFDFLITDLMRYFYDLYPESLSNKDLSVSLSELKTCKDIQEAVDYAVSKEIDKVLYKSLSEQIRYFETFLKIECKNNFINWEKLNEAIERRNIIVHNNSVINRRYLRNINVSVLNKKKKDLKEGNQIKITKDYFMGILDEFYIAGIVLMQSCWRKWKKEDVKFADEELISNSYSLLVQEKWSMAERLGLFSQTCSLGNEQNRLYLDINHCQALKWQGKKGSLEKEIKKFDISSLSPIYKLALHTLRSDRKNFYKHLKDAVIVDGLNKDAINQWPLFREFRKDPNYEKRTKRILRLVSKKKKR